MNRIHRIHPLAPTFRPISIREMTHDRLAWLYGADRAALIMDGQDERTQADVRAWVGLGR